MNVTLQLVKNVFVEEEKEEEEEEERMGGWKLNPLKAHELMHRGLHTGANFAPR